MLELYTSPHCLISSSFCSFIFVIIMLPNILKNSVRKFYSSGRNFQVEISQCSQYIRINKTKITLSWLRDHCRSEFNYDSRNNQRNFEYPKETKFKDLNVINNHLKINWQDGHKSSYPLDELESSVMLSSNDDLDHVSSSFKSPKLWAAHNIHSDQIKIDFNSYMATNIGLQYVIDNIWTHGFCIITQVPLSIDKGTKPVAGRIGPRFQGPEDEFWVLKGGETPENLSDTSYTNLALEPHTDGTFFSVAPGIQIFHCHQESTCRGGETILVDGFYLAEQFRSKCPDGYKFLSSYPIESEYIHRKCEPHAHYLNKDVIFKHCQSSGNLNQIRLNAYDRAPHSDMNLEEQTKFYKYFPELIDLSKDSHFLLKFQLKSGEILLVNNWRLLHGRTAFEGKRLLSGCYLSMDVFKSRTLSMHGY